VTTYHLDFERRANGIAPEVLARELESTDFDSLGEFYQALVDFFRGARYREFPKLEADVLYRQPTGTVTDYRGLVAGHYTDARDRFTLLMANGDKVVLIKPREGQV